MLGTWDIRARGALLIATACALAAAPAAASTRLAWSEHGAGLPATFEAVALDAGAGLVVAAGRDAESGAALLAEDAGDGWTLVDAALPAGTTLTDVALDGGEAWAVGSVAGAGVAVRRAAEGGWASVPVPAGVPGLRSVALAPGAGAGYAGDDAGALHAITGGSVAAEGLVAPGGGAITGLALRGPADGFAVAAPTSLGAGGGIHRLTSGLAGPALQPMPATRSSSGLPPVDVAASATGAIARSGTHLWRLSADGGSWSVETALPTGASVPAAALAAIDVAADGTEVVAGAWGGDGAVWRRTPAGWLRDDAVVAQRPLTAIAARAADDLVAAGAGAAFRYGPVWEPEPEPTPDPTPEPEPEPTPSPEPEETPEPEPSPTPTAEPAAEETDGEAEPSGHAADADPKSPAPAAHPEPAPMAPPAVVVSTPPAKKPARPKTVLSDIRVSPQPRRLVITFRLSARARVSFAAARGKRVVGRTSTKALRPGRWQVVLRYRGRRVPTALKAVVNPTKKAKSTRRVP